MLQYKRPRVRVANKIKNEKPAKADFPCADQVELESECRDSFAFLQIAKIIVRLRQAVGGNAHPRCTNHSNLALE